MSKEINNREYRQQVIKDLISQLHAGKTVDEVKGQFEEAFSGVSATEISAAEQALIQEGLPISEVQRLCDVHAAVFKGSIEEIHAGDSLENIPGHPVQVLKQENIAIIDLLENRIEPHKEAFLKGDSSMKDRLLEDLELLKQIDIHYLKKENLMFPYLEKYDITGPPKVMWGVDDEIRKMVKNAVLAVENYNGDTASVVSEIDETTEKISEMVFKEENIMVPMLAETITQDEWLKISKDSKEFGYCLISDVPEWIPIAPSGTILETAEKTDQPGIIKLPTGVFNVEELTALFNALPVDITFVDKDDTVKYFSQSSERIFPRTTTIIGRNVANCHPPASFQIVEQIVADLKSGKKDHEDFWIKMKDKYVYIRYFAVRSETGEYLGVVELTQDIAPIKEIEGEKRLVND